jgi:DNA-binding response OmpR family regulator
MSDLIKPIVGNKPEMFPAVRYANARILVVDDAPFNVKLICAKLLASGYNNIETAVDGVDALKKTYQTKPDLVLLDLMMPNMDGFGYCEHIRGDSTAAHIPIIVQTALNDRETKLRALSCGADDFLNKPLDLDEVALRVHVHLERYFVLQDLENMREYLRMELEQAHTTIKHLEKNAVSISGRNLLNKHYDVLKTLTVASGEAH